MYLLCMAAAIEVPRVAEDSCWHRWKREAEREDLGFVMQNNGGQASDGRVEVEGR